MNNETQEQTLYVAEFQPIRFQEVTTKHVRLGHITRPPLVFDRRLERQMVSMVIQST